jgi:hypothetical protein
MDGTDADKELRKPALASVYALRCPLCAALPGNALLRALSLRPTLLPGVWFSYVFLQL